ncbi:MAG: SRPBCC family protein [Actinobacteria bacterium]|nr:SRPBCC family protein [Actinomycetota bacterium]
MSAPRSQRKSFEIATEHVARCDPAVVMRHLLDSSQWPRWQAEIVATVGPERVETGDVVRGHADLLGFGVAGRASIEEVESNGFTEDVLVGVRMRVTYEVRPDEGGSLVRSRIVTEAPTGLSGRVLGWLLRRRLRSMQRTSLERLARLSEEH